MPSPREHVEPLFGFRLWRVRDGKLYSIKGLRPWPVDGPKVALCWRGFLPVRVHVAPGTGCTCGLYAYKDPPLAATSPSPLVADAYGRHVWGVVSMWGRVVIHELGFRAQYARPVAVADGPDSSDIARTYSLIHLARLEDWRG